MTFKQNMKQLALLVLGLIVMGAIIYAVSDEPDNHNKPEPEEPSAIDTVSGSPDKENGGFDISGFKREVMTWEAVKDSAISDDGTSIWIGVFDNGQNRRGYAMSVCELVREHSTEDGGFHVIRVMDIIEMSANDKIVELGRYNCST